MDTYFLYFTQDKTWLFMLFKIVFKWVKGFHLKFVNSNKYDYKKICFNIMKII